MNDEEQVAREGEYTKGGNALFFWGTIIIVMAGLIYILIPVVIRSPTGGSAMTAVHNSKDIYTAIRAYAFDHGGVSPPWRTTANESFALLFESGHCKDEVPFFRGDAQNLQDDFKSNREGKEGEILAAGSNVFSYWTNIDGGGVNITEAPANTPILSVPMLYSSADEKFHTAYYNSESYGGQAVVLRSDGSAQVYPLDDKGQLLGDEGNRIAEVVEDGLIDYKHYKVAYPKGCQPVQ